MTLEDSEQPLMSGINPSCEPTEYIRCLFHANVGHIDVHPLSTFTDCEFMGGEDLGDPRN